MPRPRQLPPGGERLHVVFPKPLARRLRLLATQLEMSVSTVIQGMVEERLPSKEREARFPWPEEPFRAVLMEGYEFLPVTWTGSDLKQRLYALHRSQKEMVEASGIPQQTLNRWILKGFVPPERRGEIRVVLEKWMSERAAEGDPLSAGEPESLGDTQEDAH